MQFILARLPAFFSPKQSGQDDKHYGPQRAKLPAEWSARRHAQCVQTNLFSNRAPAFSFPPNHARTNRRSSATPSLPVELPSWANNPLGTVAKRALDCAKTPKCPIARCACVQAVATPCAARPLVFVLANHTACPQRPCSMGRAPRHRPAASQAAPSVSYLLLELRSSLSLKRPRAFQFSFS